MQHAGERAERYRQRLVRPDRDQGDRCGPLERARPRGVTGRPDQHLPGDRRPPVVAGACAATLAATSAPDPAPATTSEPGSAPSSAAWSAAHSIVARASGNASGHADSTTTPRADERVARRLATVVVELACRGLRRRRPLPGPDPTVRWSASARVPVPAVRAHAAERQRRGVDGSEACDDSRAGPAVKGKTECAWASCTKRITIRPPRRRQWRRGPRGEAARQGAAAAGRSGRHRAAPPASVRRRRRGAQLRAGRARLYLSQPALSRQISSLERLVGCDLLRRSTHRVELHARG